MEVLKNQSTNRLTPLGIIALFLSLTEVVVGVGVIQTDGAVQVVLTAFVVLFPLLIAGAFFTILWSQAYVLYPPTEYKGGTEVGTYVEAFHRVPAGDRLLRELESIVRSAVSSPELAAEIVKVVSEGNGRPTPTEIAEVTRVLESAADQAAEQLADEFIEIIWLVETEEAVTLLYSDISFEAGQGAMDLLRVIMAVNRRVFGEDYNLPTYGYTWKVRDGRSGRYFDLSDFGVRKRKDRNAWIESRRSTDDVGVAPGSRLEVVRLFRLPNEPPRV